MPTKTLGPAHIFTIGLMVGAALFLALSDSTTAALNAPWSQSLLTQSHSALDEGALLVGLAAVNALLIATAASTTWDLRRQRQSIDLVTSEG